MKIFFAISLACWCFVAAGAGDERLFIDGKINQQPARFFFDTGSGVAFALFSTAVPKFGLKVAPPAPDGRIGPGQIAVGWTEACSLEIADTNFATQFAVVKTPAYLKWDADGVLGWQAVSNNFFFIDFESHTFVFFTNAPEVPPPWIKFNIPADQDDLTLELPADHGEKLILALDSGCAYGVELNPKKWHEWKLAHADQPATLEAYYMPNPGVVVTEEMWADQISLGPLTLTGVPVEEANSADVALHSSRRGKYAATLGFAALKRLDILIDGRHGVAYLRPRKTPPLPYTHNRLGAVFVPRNLQSNDLVAHVAAGSPAGKAGIRNDDVLLKIGKLDVTRWRTDPTVLPLSRFFDASAGTKLELTLKRGDQVFKTAAELKNILPHSAPEHSN